VMLNQPSGPAQVFARTEATNESAAPALGRILGIGTLSTTPEITGPLPQTAAQKALEAFDQAGVEPRSLAAVSGSPTDQIAHNALRDFMPSASTVRSADQSMLTEAGQRVDELAST